MKVFWRFLGKGDLICQSISPNAVFKTAQGYTGSVKYYDLIFVRRKVSLTKILPLTGDTWHLTRDTWHVTYDTWHVTHGRGWTFSQNFSSPDLMVWDGQCLEYSERNDDSMNEWNNDFKKVYIEQPWLHQVYYLNLTRLIIRTISCSFNTP